jgi:hypothetical protein
MDLISAFLLALFIVLVTWGVLKFRARVVQEAIQLRQQEINDSNRLIAEANAAMDAEASKEWLKQHNSLHRDPEKALRDAQEDRRARADFARKTREADIAAREAEIAAREAEIAEMQKWRALTKVEQTEVWLAERSRPSPEPLGVSARGAEKLAALWLAYLGEEDVIVTQEVGDGGVDVISANFCCQVKNYKKQPVTSSEIRDLYGTAHAMGLKPLLMTSSYLSSDALDWASRNGVAAINFHAEDGTLTSLNNLGEDLLEGGKYHEPLPDVWPF